MEATSLPVTPEEWKHVMKLDGEPILVLSLRRPVFPDSGKTGRIERYFDQVALQWKKRWETFLFPRACQALADARERSRPFLPWRAELDYTITLWNPPLLSLRLDAKETGQEFSRPARFCMGETWDCATGYPRTLRSFFPIAAHRWRKELLDGLKEQAAQQLTSGESLLDPDCAQIMARTFDPDRFYLTEEGLCIFFPLYVLGPYAEGLPTFSFPLPEQAQEKVPPS